MTKTGELRLKVEQADTKVIQEAEEALFDIRAKVAYSPKRRAGCHSVKATIGDKTLLSQISNNLRGTQFLRFASSSTNDPTAVSEYWRLWIGICSPSMPRSAVGVTHRRSARSRNVRS